MYRRTNLKSFDNVTAGQRALLDVDRGVRYHGIVLEYREAGALVDEATMEASIEEIVVKINEIEQWRIDPATLFDVERANDKEFTVSNGMIPLYFSDFIREGVVQKVATGIGTLGVNSFTVEVMLASGATSPSLKAHGFIDDVSEAPNLIRKLSKKTEVINAIGDHKFSLNRRGVTHKALHFFETTAGDVDNIRLQYEGIQIVNHSPEVIAEMFKPFRYTQQSKQIFLPLDHKTNADALKSQIKQANGTFRDVNTEITLTMSGAQNVSVVEEYYGLPNA